MPGGPTIDPAIDPAIDPGIGPATCPLCRRPLAPDAGTDLHHPVPRSHGGTITVPMHRICHQTIHALFSERELAERYYSFAALLEDPAIQRFVTWVRKRPADYLDRTRWSRARRRK
ncbi:MAG: HNH endonuclease [Rhodospirillaceae bacterium]|nr:MAG: HNH endonuclease [Rhodospirillaceae bacterium]